jgi:hypothetical protein
MKILVVGFPRSGTSMTNRIFASNPDVKKMFFEKWMLKRGETKQELMQKHPVFNNTCGEKVIWAKRVTGKIGTSNESIVDYCHKWNRFFGKEARIIQIVRHPYDSLNSLVISKKRFPRGPVFKANYHEYQNYALQFFKGIHEIDNCFTIKYEDLITNPEVNIRRMYEHCNINPDHKIREKMKVGRVFNYKEKDFLFEYNDKLKEIIDLLNTFEGVKYEY